LLTSQYLRTYSLDCHVALGPFHQKDLKWALTIVKPTPLHPVPLPQKRNGFAVVVNQGPFPLTCTFCVSTALKIHRKIPISTMRILSPVHQEGGHTVNERKRPPENRRKTRQNIRFFQHQTKPGPGPIKERTPGASHSHCLEISRRHQCP